MSTESSTAVANKEEIGSVATSDFVLAGLASVKKGDIGQYAR